MKLAALWNANDAVKKSHIGLKMCVRRVNMYTKTCLKFEVDILIGSRFIYYIIVQTLSFPTTYDSPFYVEPLWRY